MDIGRAFAYISEDKEWTKKLLLGAVIGAIPIANFAIFGYQIQVARNVAAAIDRPEADLGSPLPDWNDFGRLLTDGLRFIAAFFIFMLPIFVLIGCMTGAMVMLAAGQPEAFSATSSAPPPPEFFALFGLMFACVMPYSLLLYAVWPMFGIQIARRGSVGSCLQFAEMWRLVRTQPTDYLLIVLIFFGLYLGVSLVMLPVLIVVFIPCIGYFIYLGLTYGAIMLVLMVTGHLQGQFIAADNRAQSGNEMLEPVLE
ncbi:MAG: DUF4013 domain-containing protein [Chloroflexi bacterium]|nr:DUF4013 domain-containing protein [Ardenticatenaceae bacterium]NOG35275.1 DUF4013 domain-containing protein [Chloroflexota bacterium]GIK58438.1 MAG: hypothetical protein BroJett015_41010 [Chloroflexota bacterium]